MTVTEIEPRRIRAHELYGDFWFNSAPVPVSALRGRVIVLLFWDYACTYSLHALPYVLEWNRKYEQYGLVTIGVHRPKFPFGKNPEYVRKAIERNAISFPVVVDNEGLIATNYGQRSWPTIHIVDKHGFVRYQKGGEGSYLTTERVIQTMLHDAGAEGDLPYLMDPLRAEDKIDAVCFKATPEIFAGYLRGSIGNVEGFSPESVVDYIDPELYVDDRIYAVGSWMNGKNSLRFDGSENAPGKIVLGYHALEVNAVIEPQTKYAEVLVEQDHRSLTDENKGADILIRSDGSSVVVLDEPRLYNIVKNRHFGEHLLQMSTESDGFTLYSFTCTSSVIPEFVSRN